MSTWTEMAKDNRLAANEARAAQRWRTCVSRAYYAVYSELTELLISQNVMMPAGRANPRHERLSNMVEANLKQFTHPVRVQLAGAVRQLYKLRVMADYMPLIAVEHQEAKIALGLLCQVYRCLEAKS